MANGKAEPSRTTVKNNSILVAEAQDIGYGQQRKRLEDRCAIDASLQTAGGLQLAVGMVADGVGGASAGEVAGQTVIDAVMEHIKNSTGKDINQILEDAMLAAHKALRDMAMQSTNLRTMSTTGTLAAVHEGRLYLAHVGDSRAYLVREGKIQQLTLDHTWGNEMIRQERFSAEEMEKHSKRGDLGRYFGQPVPFEVDIGLRFFDKLLPGVHPAKSSLMQQGFALQPGDVILLCTDGLIKPRRKAAGHYLEPEEIIKVVQRKRGAPQDTANTLVSLALGRQVDDNVTAVIMEVPGGKATLSSFLPVGLPKPKTGGLNSQWRWAIASLIGALLLVLGAIILPALISASSQKTATPTTLAGDTPAVTAAGEMGYARLVGGIAEYQLPDQVATTWELEKTVNAGSGVTIRTRAAQATIELSDGATVVYIDTGSTLYLESVAGVGSKAAETRLVLEEGRLVVSGAELVVAASGIAFEALIPGQPSVMGVDYASKTGDFQVDCLGGFCRVESGFGDLELLAGSGMATTNFHNFSQSGPVAYETWLALGGQAVPTPTPTLEASPTPAPSDTPAVAATQTPPGFVAPTPTPSPKPGRDPHDTATSVPPTNTPAPPTDTPKPPPPTNTPPPPPTKTAPAPWEPTWTPIP